MVLGGGGTIQSVTVYVRSQPSEVRIACRRLGRKERESSQET